MPVRDVPFETAMQHVEQGACLIDLRSVDPYLEVHVPGSVALHYEFGPGMASRARDCLPLDVPLILLELGEGDIDHAAASLRGKGFAVVGKMADAINQWAANRGAPASTEVVEGPQLPPGTVLDVGDRGAPGSESALHIAVESLWGRVGEITVHDRIIVAAGAGVRAALAVGVLERAGVREIVFWRRVTPPPSPWRSETPGLAP